MKKPKYPRHYLNLNGNGLEAVEKYKTILLGASQQEIEYHHGEEIEDADPREVESLLYATALRLNNKQRALTEAAEGALLSHVYQHALFSKFNSIDEWIMHHNIKSAGQKSEFRSIAEIIIPWCQQFKVLPGDDTEIEEWFFQVPNDQDLQPLSILRRVAHFTPVLKAIIRDDEMSQGKKVDEIRTILAMVSNLKNTNQQLANAARGYLDEKMVAQVYEKENDTVRVIMTIKRSQLEYLQEKRLRNLVDFEFVSHANSED